MDKTESFKLHYITPEGKKFIPSDWNGVSQVGTSSTFAYTYGKFAEDEDRAAVTNAAISFRADMFTPLADSTAFFKNAVNIMSGCAPHYLDRDDASVNLFLKEFGFTPKEIVIAGVRQTVLAPQRYGDGFIGTLQPKGRINNSSRLIPFNVTPIYTDVEKSLVEVAIQILKNAGNIVGTNACRIRFSADNENIPSIYVTIIRGVDKFAVIFEESGAMCVFDIPEYKEMEKRAFGEAIDLHLYHGISELEQSMKLAVDNTTSYMQAIDNFFEKADSLTEFKELPEKIENYNQRKQGAFNNIVQMLAKAMNVKIQFSLETPDEK